MIAFGDCLHNDSPDYADSPDFIFFSAKCYLLKVSLKKEGKHPVKKKI